MTAELKASRSDTTLILTFSNPGQCNAPDGNVLAAAVETLSKAERDDSVSAVILTGADGDFCGGIYSGKDFSEKISALENMHSLIEAICSFSKPIVAAVEGTVADAGFSMALACDLIVAAQASRFSVNNIGTAGGASWFLQKALPPQLVAEILFDEQAIPASRLQAAGIINKLVSDDTALDRALVWTEHLALTPTAKYAKIKTAVGHAVTKSLSEVFIAEKHNLLASI